MTPEEEKQFNIDCAEFMGYHNIKIDSIGELRCRHVNDEFSFEPFSDSNDRDMVIEKMKISIDVNDSKLWKARIKYEGPCAYHEDRNTVINECIRLALIEWGISKGENHE